MRIRLGRRGGLGSGGFVIIEDDETFPRVVAHAGSSKNEFRTATEQTVIYDRDAVRPGIGSHILEVFDVAREHRSILGLCHRLVQTVNDPSQPLDVALVGGPLPRISSYHCMFRYRWVTSTDLQVGHALSHNPEAQLIIVYEQ